MTHRIFVPQAPQANRALAKRPLWLIVLLLALWLGVLLLAMQAYPQSAGPEFPIPGNAHMSRDNQRRLGPQAAAQIYQALPEIDLDLPAPEIGLGAGAERPRVFVLDVRRVAHVE